MTNDTTQLKDNKHRKKTKPQRPDSEFQEKVVKII